MAALTTSGGASGSGSAFGAAAVFVVVRREDAATGLSVGIGSAGAAVGSALGAAFAAGFAGAGEGDAGALASTVFFAAGLGLSSTLRTRSAMWSGTTLS